MFSSSRLNQSGYAERWNDAELLGVLNLCEKEKLLKFLDFHRNMIVTLLKEKEK